jgi:DNA-binding NarL/FixJ family response regulator
MEFGLGAAFGSSSDQQAKQNLKIVLVDASALLREGLKALLERESDLAVVGDFACAEDCLAHVGSLRPDVVLTDTNLPGMSGIELLSELRRRGVKVRSLVLTSHDDQEHIRGALNAGADGYVLKSAHHAELTLAVRAVQVGRHHLCRATSSQVLAGYFADGRRSASSEVTRTITEREREVLTRIALGNSNKLIARELGVSPKTVEKHRSNLMRKLQLHNTAAITMFAIRNGLTGGEPYTGQVA